MSESRDWTCGVCGGTGGHREACPGETELFRLTEQLAAATVERDELRSAAQWLCDQAYRTDDGQSYVVDPQWLYALRELLDGKREGR